MSLDAPGAAGEEAAALWQGFLWSPRVSPPLAAAFKSNYLVALGRWRDLGEYGGICCQLFAVMITDLPPDIFSAAETREALRRMGKDGRVEVLATFARTVRESADGAAALWHGRLAPWFDRHWSPDRADGSDQISSNLAEIATETRDAFPDAAGRLGRFIDPACSGFQILCFRIAEGELTFDIVEQFPTDTLRLLSRLIADDADPAEVYSLSGCLARLRPHLADADHDQDFERLTVIARRAGI